MSEPSRTIYNAGEFARHPRSGLEATKRIVASIRAGRPGDDATAYAATLSNDGEARARIAAFITRRNRV